MSSVMRPLHPAFRIALSTASILSHPCSGAISGRYVAEKLCFKVLRAGTTGGEDKGEGVEEGEEEVGSNDGCGNDMWMP